MILVVHVGREPTVEQPLPADVQLGQGRGLDGYAASCRVQLRNVSSGRVQGLIDRPPTS